MSNKKHFAEKAMTLFLFSRLINLDIKKATQRVPSGFLGLLGLVSLLSILTPFAVLYISVYYNANILAT